MDRQHTRALSALSEVPKHQAERSSNRHQTIRVTPRLSAEPPFLFDSMLSAENSASCEIGRNRLPATGEMSV